MKKNNTAAAENHNCDRKAGKKMHILIVSQYFHPETFRINDMAAEWVKRGCRVTVLTGIPNYPSGKFYKGYDWHHRRSEVWNGIEIIRIPIIPRGSSSIGLAVNYISFAASGWIWKTAASIRPDLVFTFGISPMTQALAGVWYAKKRHIPHFLYVQDLWPENVELVTGIHNPVIIRPIEKMMDYIYRNTDQIFVTSGSFVDAIVKRNKHVPRQKVHYWPQYAEEFYQPADTGTAVKEIPSDDSFKIAFTGNIGYAQGLDILPRAAELLRKENIRFIIIGDGRYMDELKQETIRRHVADKFIIIPRQNADRMPYFLAAADAAYLSCLDPDTIPAKVQSYMACGKCLLASAGTEMKNLIEEADCGICCRAGDEKALAKAVRELMSDKDRVRRQGKNARKYFLSHFEKSKLMDEMDRYFSAALLKADRSKME